MKIAISNIAWNLAEDTTIISVLKKYEIKGIEIAPTKIWGNPTEESLEEIKKYRKFWEKHGISIVATQSLLYGHPQLNIFDSQRARKQTLAYLKKIIRISANLGANAMVFGSPKNRDRKKMKDTLALEIASEFFYAIGEFAQKYNIFFCIEPNPKEYGTNFVNNTNEAIILINLVNHPYFRLHLDTGALTVNKEEYKNSIKLGFPYMKHFHISEKDLLPVGRSLLDHKKIAQILKNLHYNKWVSVEMRGMNNQDNDRVVDEVLEFVSNVYA